MRDLLSGIAGVFVASVLVLAVIGVVWSAYMEWSLTNGKLARERALREGPRGRGQKTATGS